MTMLNGLKVSLRRILLPSSSVLVNVWWLTSWLITITLLVLFVISLLQRGDVYNFDLQLIENFGQQDAWLPALISAAGGLISSVIGSNSQSSANKMNYYMMQEQNKFNAVEAEKQRNWQNSQWWSQFNAENAYNDPKNQMARMEAAGINPFIAAENSTKVGTTAANPSVPSAAVATAAPYHPVISPWASSQFPQNLSAIVGAFKTLAEAKKVGLDTQLEQDTYDTIVKQVNENLKSTQLQNKFQEIQNVFEPLVKKYGLQKTWAEYLKALSEKDVNVQRVQEVFQNTLHLAEQRAKTKAEREQIEKLTPVLVKQNEELTNLYKEKQETERHQQRELDTRSEANQASAFNSYAQGREALERATTEKEKRSFVVDNARSLAQLSAYDANKMLRTLETQIDLTDLQQQYMNFTIDLLRQTHDFNERYELLRALGQVLGGSASIAISHKLGE